MEREILRVLDESCEPGTHLELEVEGNTVIRMTKVKAKKGRTRIQQGKAKIVPPPPSY